MKNVIFNFNDENFVVTGASSGMGKQVVIELAQNGANVLAIARGLQALTELKTHFPKNIQIASIDVCNYEGMEDAIKRFVSENGKINGVVHAAGIGGMTTLRAYDKELAEKIMQISFWGGINLVQMGTKAKYAKNGASYVLFSSVSSVSGEKGMFAYSAAKAALNTAVKSIAKEINIRGHRINCIVPGWVRSPMTAEGATLADANSIIAKHPLGAGNVEDVSGVVLFLLSDRAKWITGTSIVIDGGYLA